MSGRGSGTNTYWCCRCKVVCSIRYGGVSKGTKQRGKRFCMVCGESSDLVLYSERPPKEQSPVLWTTKEERVLERLTKESGMTTKQAAEAMKRTISSVYAKKRSLGLIENPRPYRNV